MNPFPESAKAHELFEAIRAEIPLAELGPGRPPASDWERTLRELDDTTLLGTGVADRDMTDAVRSGLLLRANLLDASHSISQSIKTSTGSYWHGIMHRREGDFGNSKYWFGRVGDHPLFETLSSEARSSDLSESAELLTGPWDPYRFIDLCEAKVGKDDTLARELVLLQDLEMALLLSYCFDHAKGN